jgi:hypothetical protein
MLFRAIFWIGVVAVLMPHEPDLGLGRPGDVRAFLPGSDRQTSLSCRGYGETCASALGALDSFQSIAVRSLAQVKADIEEDERTAARRHFRND